MRAISSCRSGGRDRVVSNLEPNALFGPLLGGGVPLSARSTGKTRSRTGSAPGVERHAEPQRQHAGCAENRRRGRGGPPVSSVR